MAEMKEVWMARVARFFVGAAGVFTLALAALTGPAGAAISQPSVCILAAPVQVATTADGAVGYRRSVAGRLCCS